MYSYCSADVINTLNIHNRLRLSQLESKLQTLRNSYDSCDDYMMKEILSKKMRRVKDEIKKISSQCTD